MNKELKPTIVYVLASVSIICCCFGGLGVLLAAPAFIIANNRLKTVEGTEHDFQSMKSAKTFALVMLIINGLYLIYTIYVFSTLDMDMFMEEFTKGLNAS
jgi:hypothetical protein